MAVVATEEIRLVVSGAKEAAQGLRLVKTEQDRLGHSAEKADKQVQGLELILRELRKQTRAVVKAQEASTRILADQIRQIGRHARTTREATNATASHAQQLSKQASRAQDASKQTNTLDKGLQRVAFTLISVNQGIELFRRGVGVFKEAVGLASDFQRGLANISTLLSADGPSPDRIRGFLLDESLSSSKQLLDLTTGFYQTVSAGIPVVERAGGAFDVLSASQKAAVAGLSTTEKAVNSIVTGINAFKTAGFSATEVSDKLFTAVARGRITFEQLDNNLGIASALSEAYGSSMDELLAQSMTLTRAGLNMEESVTSIQSTLQGIANPAQNVSKLAKELGLDFSASALQAKGLVRVLDEIKAATGGDAGLLGQLFPNRRAIREVMILLGSGAQGFKDDLDALANSAGATQRAYEKVSGTFSETASIFKSQLQAAYINAVEGTLPRLQQTLQRLGQWLGENQGQITQTVGRMADSLLNLGEWVVTHGDDLITWAKVFFGAVIFQKAQGALVGFATTMQTLLPRAATTAGTLAAAQLEQKMVERAKTTNFMLGASMKRELPKAAAEAGTAAGAAMSAQMQGGLVSSASKWPGLLSGILQSANSLTLFVGIGVQLGQILGEKIGELMTGHIEKQMRAAEAQMAAFENRLQKSLRRDGFTSREDAFKAKDALRLGNTISLDGSGVATATNTSSVAALFRERRDEASGLIDNDLHRRALDIQGRREELEALKLAFHEAQQVASEAALAAAPRSMGGWVQQVPDNIKKAAQEAEANADRMARTLAKAQDQLATSMEARQRVVAEAARVSALIEQSEAEKAAKAAGERKRKQREAQAEAKEAAKQAEKAAKKLEQMQDRARRAAFGAADAFAEVAATLGTTRGANTLGREMHRRMTGGRTDAQEAAFYRLQADAVDDRIHRQRAARQAAAQAQLGRAQQAGVFGGFLLDGNSVIDDQGTRQLDAFRDSMAATADASLMMAQTVDGAFGQLTSGLGTHFAAILAGSGQSQQSLRELFATTLQGTGATMIGYGLSALLAAPIAAYLGFGGLGAKMAAAGPALIAGGIGVSAMARVFGSANSGASSQAASLAGGGSGGGRSTSLNRSGRAGGLPDSRGLRQREQASHTVLNINFAGQPIHTQEQIRAVVVDAINHVRPGSTRISRRAMAG